MDRLDRLAFVVEDDPEIRVLYTKYLPVMWTWLVRRAAAGPACALARCAAPGGMHTAGSRHVFSARAIRRASR